MHTQLVYDTNGIIEIPRSFLWDDSDSERIDHVTVSVDSVRRTPIDQQLIQVQTYLNALTNLRGLHLSSPGYSAFSHVAVEDCIYTSCVGYTLWEASSRDPLCVSNFPKLTSFTWNIQPQMMPDGWSSSKQQFNYLTIIGLLKRFHYLKYIHVNILGSLSKVSRQTTTSDVYRFVMGYKMLFGLLSPYTHKRLGKKSLFVKLFPREILRRLCRMLLPII